MTSARARFSGPALCAMALASFGSFPPDARGQPESGSVREPEALQDSVRRLAACHTLTESQQAEIRYLLDELTRSAKLFREHGIESEATLKHKIADLTEVAKDAIFERLDRSQQAVWQHWKGAVPVSGSPRCGRPPPK